MAKTKRNQNVPKSLSTSQASHSYSVNTSGTNATKLEPELEDDGVCVTCVDECTCGYMDAIRKSAASATVASAATISTPSASSKPASTAATHASAAAPVKRLILTLPKRQVTEPTPDSSIISNTSTVIKSKPKANTTKSHLGGARQAPTTTTTTPKTKATNKKTGRVRPGGRRTVQASANSLLRAQAGLVNNPNSNSGHTTPRPLTASAISTLKVTSGLPTFVPASVFGSDSSLSSPSSSDHGDDSDSDSDSSSELSLNDTEDDAEVEAEEERMIVEETLAMKKLRARREREREREMELERDRNMNMNNNNNNNNNGGGGGGSKWDKMNWNKNNRERKSSIGADARSDGGDASTSSSSSDDSSSDEDSDEEDGDGNSSDDEQEVGEDDEDEADDLDHDRDATDTRRLRGAFGFDSSEDEDTFDADVFFANLSDSSFDSSSDSDTEHVANPTTSTSLTTSSTQLEPSTLTTFSLDDALEVETSPFVVPHGFGIGGGIADDLVFGDDFGLLQESEDMLNAVFDAITASGFTLTSAPAGPFGGLATEDDSMAEGDERAFGEEDGGEYEELSDEQANNADMDVGETTDEDELHPQLGPIVFANSPFTASASSRFSIIGHRQHSTSTINPLATSRRSTFSSSSSGWKSSKDKDDKTPKPMTRHKHSLSVSSSASGAPSIMSSETGRLIPVMGSFSISDTTAPPPSTSGSSSVVGANMAIIDGKRDVVLPSPFPPASDVKSRDRKAGRRKRRALNQHQSIDRTMKRVRTSRPSTPTPSSSTPITSRFITEDPDIYMDTDAADFDVDADAATTPTIMTSSTSSLPETFASVTSSSTPPPPELLASGSGLTASSSSAATTPVLSFSTPNLLPGTGTRVPLPHPGGIGLQDMIDATLFAEDTSEDEVSDVISSTSVFRTGGGSKRWGGVPINAFHLIRSGNAGVGVGGVNPGVLSSPVHAQAIPTTPYVGVGVGLNMTSSPKPADGFSYGAASSRDVVFGPYADLPLATYWNGHGGFATPARPLSGPTRTRARAASSSMSSPMSVRTLSRQSSTSTVIAPRRSRGVSVSSGAGAGVGVGGTTPTGRRNLFISPVLLPVKDASATSSTATSASEPSSASTSDSTHSASVRPLLEPSPFDL